jgi:predicted transcriptional regulator
VPRRLTLSPLQRDIVMMLEEAGAETVGTVIATLKPSDQGEFAARVDGLVTLGLIRKEENNLLLTEKGESLYGRRPVLNWRNIQFH